MKKTRQQIKAKAKNLFTIGYEQTPSKAVLDELESAGVKLLVDVRAVTSSRRPGFSKNQLAAGLDERGIAYVHLKGLGTPKEGRLAGRDVPAERWAKVEAVQRYADERNVTILDVAIGGLLAMPAIVSVIAGATKPEQVRANVKAGSWEPNRGDVEALRALR